MKHFAGKMRAKDRIRLAEALDRLIAPETATNRAERSATWRAEKDALRGSLPPPYATIRAKL